jgi:hypothetical protein
MKSVEGLIQFPNRSDLREQLFLGDSVALNGTAAVIGDA